jgi:hypothetical protein
MNAQQVRELAGNLDLSHLDERAAEGVRVGLERLALQLDGQQVIDPDPREDDFVAWVAGLDPLEDPKASLHDVFYGPVQAKQKVVVVEYVRDRRQPSPTAYGPRITVGSRPAGNASAGLAFGPWELGPDPKTEEDVRDGVHRPATGHEPSAGD